MTTGLLRDNVRGEYDYSPCFDSPRMREPGVTHRAMLVRVPDAFTQLPHPRLIAIDGSTTISERTLRAM